MENRELISTFEKKIEEKLEKAKERLEKSKVKLKDNTKKVSFIDKIAINADIKSLQKEITGLTELSQSFYKLKSSNNSKYKLPDKLKDNFDKLGSLLQDQEVNQLRDNVNKSLRNVNLDKKEIIKKGSINIQNLLNKLNIKNDKTIVKGDIPNNSALISLETLADKIEKNMLKELSPEYSFISNKSAKIELDTEDRVFLTSLKEMIAEKELEKNKNTDLIINNLSEIEELFINRKRINNTLLILSNTLIELNNVNEIDFTSVKTYLKNIEINYRKELDKINKYLNKFDFTSVKEQIKGYREKKEKEEEKKYKYQNYQNLSYELEKVMLNEPDNHEKISKLKEEMRYAAMNSGLTNEQLNSARVEGQKRYNIEVREQKARTAAIKEKVEYEDNLKKDVMRQLREYAIKELERNNAFEGNYEYRNGDVYSSPVDREAMIQRKMAELKRLADLSPVERGLEDQKRRGYISNDTKLEDLSYQRINDLKIAYSDESYEFMPDYKKWQEREDIKPLANNIYRQYIKYRASLKDKNDFLSFSKYAEQMHNIENMNETMVDYELQEELKEEVRGMKR